MSDDDMLEVKRPMLGHTFMEVASVFARRATCPRASVGAVLVIDGVIVSHGWNGAPREQRHCTDVGCDMGVIRGRDSCQRAVHAEMNVLLNACRSGVRTLGASMYVTHSPCMRCAWFIIQAGVGRVVYLNEYADSGVPILMDSGVSCVKQQ